MFQDREKGESPEGPVFPGEGKKKKQGKGVKAMILVLKNGADKEKVEQLKSQLMDMGLKLHLSDGVNTSLIGLIGDTTEVDAEWLGALEVVDAVKRIKEPYKKANKDMHPKDTVIETAGRKIGGGYFQIIAGPCSVETREQMTEVAWDVKKAGAGLLRGGAFKPRTSPYAFQGLGKEGLRMLLEAKKATGLPIVTEIMSADHLPLFEEVDMIQVGTRNMQNFELLKELGKVDKPVLLKRGMANTLEELLMSAEYIMAGGNEKVILCERGIRTFETSMRNTLDISAIPMLKSKTHLPVIVDPSHAAGLRFMVEPLTMAAIAAGADGVMIEVHNNPEKALCDGKQSMTPEGFSELMEKVKKTAGFFGKTM